MSLSCLAGLVGGPWLEDRNSDDLSGREMFCSTGEDGIQQLIQGG